MGASSDPTPRKPGNAGGGKGPQFKTDARRGEGPGGWETYQLRRGFVKLNNPWVRFAATRAAKQRKSHEFQFYF